MIGKLNHVGVATPSIEDSVRLYRDVLDDLAEAAEQALGRLAPDARELDDTVETAVSRAVKKASQRIWGRRPVVETTVLRI